MHALARGLVVAAAAILPGRARRERYREQWLADAEGAAEAGFSPVSVAVGAVRAALLMNLTGRAVVLLGLVAVLVVGGIRLATSSPAVLPGVAIALTGLVLPVVLLVARRLRERGRDDAPAARPWTFSAPAIDGDRLVVLVVAAVVAALVVILLGQSLR
ncbi:hypothetical protein [Nonomuraea sp. NPDC003214]